MADKPPLVFDHERMVHDALVRLGLISEPTDPEQRELRRRLAIAMSATKALPRGIIPLDEDKIVPPLEPAGELSERAISMLAAHGIRFCDQIYDPTGPGPQQGAIAALASGEQVLLMHYIDHGVEVRMAPGRHTPIRSLSRFMAAAELPLDLVCSITPEWM